MTEEQQAALGDLREIELLFQKALLTAAEVGLSTDIITKRIATDLSLPTTIDTPIVRVWVMIKDS